MLVMRVTALRCTDSIYYHSSGAFLVAGLLGQKQDLILSWLPLHTYIMLRLSYVLGQ